MGRWVALLRGINVGRAKRVAMADLRELLAGLGYENVRTLLNSGNAVFEAPGKSGVDHARRIEAALVHELKVAVPVVVKSAREIAAAITDNPLNEIATDPSRLLFVFTGQASSLKTIAGLGQTDWSPGAILAGRHAAYIWCPGGILQSKAAAEAGRILGEAATTRNWATVEKINAILQE